MTGLARHTLTIIGTEGEGYDGLFDRRRQRPSPKRVPLDVVGQVLTLYREQYADFNVLHFQEKLRAQHGIDLSYTWVKTALQTAGLVASHTRRGSHRQARPRRPLPGMLLHTDASTHARIPGLDGRQDLIAVLDDATSAGYYAHFGPEESTGTMLAAFQGVIETRGLFCAPYVDRAMPMATCSSPAHPSRRPREHSGQRACSASTPWGHARSGEEAGHLTNRTDHLLSPPDILTCS